ncbi:MAG: menaquinone biosynthetic enzyme MqnA/MqnD family protein [Chthoniobacterales bacterium]
MNSPRLGCVKYLNARPLIHGWPGPVTFDHPSALCAQLARGDLDIALVSSFEFLRNPIYRIVDGISISSDGPVYSVVVAHLGELSRITEIELDPASETSVNLLRCILAEIGLRPRLIRNIDLPSVRPAPKAFGAGSGIGEFNSAEETGNTPLLRTGHRGRLLIGDHALRFRHEHENEFHFWDLAEEWKNLVDLPSVYALWLIRPEVEDPKSVANRLRELRDENLANLDDLIPSVVAGIGDFARANGIDAAFCFRYFRENIRFSFGQREKRGLRTFTRLCAKHGFLPKQALGFDLV